MNVGSYIFSQVVDYIPRYQFDKLVAKYHGNWHSKDLTCYNQLLHLLFGQITGCGSLRDICLCLEAHKPILYHLGFRNTVTQPSLSRANENRDYRIYEGLGTYLIGIHDSNELDVIEPELYAFYMMDKAYVDFDALFRFHLAGAYWVTRPKENMKYEILGYMELSDADRKAGVTGDFTIRLTTKSIALYSEPIRAVCVYDEEAGEEIVFITNNFDISAAEVACLYRHRWDIEVFFKWVKQNIVVKTLWGYSENAVRTHLWVAVIAYLIIARIKADYKSPYSITEVATLIRISALEKITLRELITKPRDSVNLNQSVKELTLF